MGHDDDDSINTISKQLTKQVNSVTPTATSPVKAW